MTSRAWTGATISCLMLLLTIIWYGPFRSGAPPSKDGAITVVDAARGRTSLALPRPPAVAIPVSSTAAMLTDGMAEKRAASVITAFVAQTSAPLAIERSSCERGRCRLIVYQTADYVQRGAKFYEDDKFVALARRAGVKSTSVSSYFSAERSSYVIDMTL